MKKYSTKSDISRSDVPEKVFRFCEFDEQEDYKMDILTKHHFYFSSIKDWDSDYREGTLPFDFDAINKDDIKKFTDLVVRREFPYKTASQKAVMRDKLIAEKLKFYNKGNRIQVEKMWIDIVEKYYGFLSFSHRIDNVAIWEYRGNLFKGYCIEFDCFNLVQ